MTFPRGRALAQTDNAAAADSSSNEELAQRLRSLHDHCLTDLASELESVRSGDLTGLCDNRLTGLADGLAAAVAEETSAATEQVSASAQGSSASTNEISTSSEELADLAGELDRLVAGFTV